MIRAGEQNLRDMEEASWLDQVRKRLLWSYRKNKNVILWKVADKEITNSEQFHVHETTNARVRINENRKNIKQKYFTLPHYWKLNLFLKKFEFLKDKSDFCNDLKW